MSWINKNKIVFVIVIAITILIFSFELRNVLLLLTSKILFTAIFSYLMPKLRNILLPLSAILLVLILFEGALALKSLGANSTVHRIVGWETEDYLSLHHLDDNGSWVLNHISDMHHGAGHPEYDYKISTVDCIGYFVRNVCDKNLAVYHFGDSFTFGFGVEFEKIFTASGVGTPNGINFGVPGFNPREAFFRANTIIRKIRKNPDLVGEMPTSLWFHLFMGNDVSETLKHNFHKEPNVKQPNKIFHFLNAVSERSYIVRALNGISLKVKLLFNYGSIEDHYWVEGHLTSMSNNFWNENKNAFFEKIEQEFTNLVSMFEGNIIISLIPPKEVCLSSDWVSQSVDIKNYFSSFGSSIIVVDTMNHVSCPEYLDWFYRLDTHFSASGHAMYYDNIIKPILGHKIIDGITD